MKKTSIIILSYNTYAYTKLCIESIRAYTTKGSYEIIVIDNGSTDESENWLKCQKDIHCIFNRENKGFPKGCNQGMEIALGTEIMLLNSDTIVTPRWLENMKYALYSNPTIGAVSCVTNSCSNMQQIEVTYNDIEGLKDFAEKYNHTDMRKWERRLKLVGFCFLLKREVYEKIGGLDEIFTPGNYEDDDYSLRIWEAGYTLLLCKDTYIHHFGSISFLGSISFKENFGDADVEEKKEKYNRCLAGNFALFKKKWNVTDHFNRISNKDIIDHLKPEVENPRIIEIGCECGMGLLYIESLYPKADISGIETNPMQARIASFTSNVKVCADIEKDIFSLLEGFYDFIIIGDIMGQFTDPEKFEAHIEYYLAPEGKVFFKFNGKILMGSKAQEKKITASDTDTQENGESKLNPCKVCFVSCVNNKEKYKEAIAYIEKLTIPKGFSIEYMPLYGYTSITEAYQYACNRSDAKYKIYLHQDVWIIHHDFLVKLIEIFQGNPEIGIAGVVGSATLPANAIWWESPKLLGAIYDDHTGVMQPYKYNGNEQLFNEAMALDGLLLATQNDVAWRKDILKDWHFYDVSQCLEFKRNGYKAVVIGQELPWCVHHCGRKNPENYNQERLRFLDEYKNEIEVNKKEILKEETGQISRQVDEKKIAFIVCQRKAERLYKRLFQSINTLIVPDGYSVEGVVVKYKNGIAAAYNEGMKQSNAKYKVYIDETAEIIHPNFIVETLAQFSVVPNAGILGMIGSILPSNGKVNQALKIWGRYHQRKNEKIIDHLFKNPLLYNQNVQVIDRLLMVTSVDKIWDETFPDFFYGIKQCHQFSVDGYKVIVSQQNTANVVFENDTDYIALSGLPEYETERQLFLQRDSKEIFPLVSILIPTYNQPEYFKMALESALNQEYRNIEIIVGDDSTDERTKMMIQPYLGKYKNLKYYYHGGPLGEHGIKNWDFVLDKSSGEYINYLLHDDLFYPDKINKMVDYFMLDESEEITMVTSIRGCIDQHGEFLGYASPWIPYRNEILTGMQVGRKILVNLVNFIGETTTVLLKKKILQDRQNKQKFYAGYFYGVRDQANVDIATWLECCRQGNCVFIAERLSDFRMHPDQNTHNPQIIIKSVLDWFNYVVLSWIHMMYIKDKNEFILLCVSWARFAESLIFNNCGFKQDAVVPCDLETCKNIYQAINEQNYDKTLHLGVEYMIGYVANKEDVLDFCSRDLDTGYWCKK